mmetsp:Transcript_142607/g.362106  ORF Transcript_142607/g.362106 Transcript_142607/m.362106 type:complete len:200 (+) Transcript_142607:430-1029(+)
MMDTTEKEDPPALGILEKRLGCKRDSLYQVEATGGSYFSVSCTIGDQTPFCGDLSKASQRERRMLAGRSPGHWQSKASSAAKAPPKSPFRYRSWIAAKSVLKASFAAEEVVCVDAVFDGCSATSSKTSVAFVRPLTATRSTGRRTKCSETPGAERTASSTRQLTSYILQSPFKREAKFTLSPTRPYFILCALPRFPAST